MAVSSGPVSMEEIQLGTDPAANEELYDNWASRYAGDVSSWGYDAPMRVAALLREHFDDAGSLSVLDAGCGDGQHGQCLSAAGFRTIDGIDLSSKMLEGARGRGCYRDLSVCDMSKPLGAVVDGKYDVTSCVGTLTYLQPESGVLAEFARITAPGGLVCFTHRTDKVDEWRQYQSRLVESGAWALVAETPPLPYLPKHPEYADKIQMKVFVYKRSAPNNE